MYLSFALFTIILVTFNLTSAFADIKGDCLGKANELRSLHESTGPLMWDDGLAARAKHWAEELLKRGYLQHSADQKSEGENLFYSFSSDGVAKCSEALYSWYSEHIHYSYTMGESKDDHVVGHFTQHVWKATTHIGIGVASKTEIIDGREIYKTYIVARYSPPGNTLQYFRNNVSPRKTNIDPNYPKDKCDFDHDLCPKDNPTCKQYAVIYGKDFLCQHFSVACPLTCGVA